MRGLPERRILDRFELAHGSPQDPSRYVVSLVDARTACEEIVRNVCLFGHTHSACFVERDSERTVEGLQPPGGGGRLGRGSSVHDGPRPVGQPRDGDPRCAFAVYDTESGAVEFIRAEHPIDRTQEKMQQVGLPDGLWQRLEYGW